MFKAFLGSFLITFGSVSHGFAQQAQNRGINFQIYVLDQSTGAPLSSPSPVSVRAQILSPQVNGVQCVLRDEIFNSVKISDGYALVVLGQGIPSSNDPGNQFAQVFQNFRGAITGNNGCVYSPKPNDERLAQISFVSPTDGSLVASAFPLRSEAYAVNADEAATLQGLPANAFIKTDSNNNLTQENLSNYFKALSGLQDGQGLVLKNGSLQATTNVNSIIAGNGVTVSANGNATTIGVNAGVGANQIVQLSSASKLPAVDGSQLTGLNSNASVQSALSSLSSSLQASITSAVEAAKTTLNTTIAALAARTTSIEQQIAGLPKAGTGAGNTVVLDSQGKLPVLDGSQLTGVNASWSNISGRPDLVLNKGGAPSVQSGLDAGKNSLNPIPANGAIYLATDSRKIYQFKSSDSTWVMMGGTDTISSSQVSGLGALAQKNSVDLSSDAGSSKLAIVNGGTGATTASEAINNLLPDQTGASGKVLKTDGAGTLSWTTPLLGTVTSVTGSDPIVVGTNSTTPVISIKTANETTAGAISSDDWRKFNNKLDANLAEGQVLVGSVNSAAVGRNLNISDIKSAQLSGNWMQATGGCDTGKKLDYSSVTDSLSCADFLLTQSQTRSALGDLLWNMDRISSNQFDINYGSNNTVGSIGAGMGYMYVSAYVPGVALGLESDSQVAVFTKDHDGVNNTGTVDVKTGKAVDGNSGVVWVHSGNTTGSGNSGDAKLFSGDASGTGNSGSVRIYTGQAPTGTRGDISLEAIQTLVNSDLVIGNGKQIKNLKSLDVAGSVRVGFDATQCSSNNAGAQRYNAGSMEYCDSNNWLPYRAGSGGLNSITVTGPLSSTGNNNMVISIGASSKNTDGYLSWSDFEIFSNKLDKESQFSGDVSGSQKNGISVNKINGVPLIAGPVSSGKVLRHDGAGWAPSYLSLSDLRKSDGGFQFPPSCTGGQALNYSSISDAFVCATVTVSGLGALSSKNSVDLVSDVGTTTLPITNGGTGAKNPTDAINNLLNNSAWPGGLLSGKTSSGKQIAVNGALNSASDSTQSWSSCAGATADFSNVNYQTISSSISTDCPITLKGMVAGGSYTLIVTGSPAVTYSFSNSPSSVKYLPANGPTTANADTIYTFIFNGTTVYVTWSSGYQ